MEHKLRFMPQGRTKLVEGSVLQPELSGLRLVMVPCSETGKPDTALHLLLDRKWPNVARQLKGWFAQHFDFKLGSINSTAVQSDVWIVNALCYSKEGKLNMAALEQCIKKISALALSEKASVHISAPLLETMPTLQELVGPYFLEKGVHCYFYTDNSLVKVAEPEASEVAVVENAPVKTSMVKSATKPRKVKTTVKTKKTAPKVKVAVAEPAVVAVPETDPKPE